MSRLCGMVVKFASPPRPAIVLRMRWLSLLVLLVPNLACAAAPTIEPARGVTYRHGERRGTPLRLHVVTVDLTDPSVSVVVRPAGADPDGVLGPWETTLMTVRAVANRDDLAVAVNGDFFSPKDSHEIM